MTRQRQPANEAEFSTCPIERLLRASAVLQRVDPEVGAWLSSAINMHVREGVSLDSCLGLARPKGRSARFEFLRRHRDQSLALALAELDQDHERLAAEIRKFETRVPDHVREAAQPPADWPDWRKAIHAAYRLGMGLRRQGVRLPSTAKGLRKSLGTEGGLFGSGSLSETGAIATPEGENLGPH